MVSIFDFGSHRSKWAQAHIYSCTRTSAQKLNEILVVSRLKPSVRQNILKHSLTQSPTIIDFRGTLPASP